ncbi:MAG: YhjD/YihY/BrkB family envelope integrity protein [Helicobacter sp.]|nr:YhjD/YihY/BrkB family envelope integrity protein [Helicobacter sp.]
MSFLSRILRNINFKKSFKLFYISILEFFNSEILYFAASLSFYTIFSIIPILWIILWITLSIDPMIWKLILHSIIPSSINIDDVVKNSIANASKMGTFGILYMLLTSFLFVRNYMFISSKMLDKSPHHNLGIQLITYVIFMIGIPAFALLALFVNKILLEHLGFGGILKLLVNAALFALLFLAGARSFRGFLFLLLSSLICAILWQGISQLFVNFIAYNTAYPSIYGGMGIFLVFLFWVYLFFIVLLFGMRICAFLEFFFKNTK